MRSQFIGLMALAVLLAGCNQQASQPQSAAGVEVRDQAPLDRGAAEPSAQDQLNKALPVRIELDFPYEFRTTRGDKGEDGEPLRSASVEFLSGDARSVQREIERPFAAIGYTPSESLREVRDQVYSRTYANADGHQIEFITNSRSDVQLRHPDATGVGRFRWAAE